MPASFLLVNLIISDNQKCQV